MGKNREARRERFPIEEDVDDRLDRYLADRLRLSRSRIADLIAEERVTVDGAPTKKSHRPEAGEEIEVVVPPRPEPDLEPQDLPLPILHEDEQLAVVDKPAGMVVHPAPGHPDGTMVNALLAKLDRLASLGGDTRPGIVHRLDKDTSGLLVVAKTDEAYRALRGALQRREVERGYLAAAWGHVDEDEFTVDRPIGRDPNDGRRRAVVEDGKRAVTHVRRLERWVSADLIALRLETGRTHQIRVHLLDVGHPLVGDPYYADGWEKGFVGAGGRWAEELARRTGRLFLHAARLGFEHPVTGERMRFHAPLPDELAEAVEWARESSAP